MNFDIKNELDDFGKGDGRYNVCIYHDELIDLFVSTALRSELDPEKLYNELMTAIPKTESLALIYCDLLRGLLESRFATETGVKIAHEHLKSISERSTEGYLGALRSLFEHKSETASELLRDLSLNSTDMRAQAWATRILSMKNGLQDDNLSSV